MDELRSSSPRATPRLETRDLHAGYAAFEVLHGISIAVPDRAIVTLLGHNGAGKSTLLKAIAGQIPSASGDTLFAGERIVRRDTGTTARMGIRYVPQDANVFSNMTVRDNLTVGAYANAPGPAELAKQFGVVYALFPALQERERVYARVLSGGQRQMLAISMALMTAPKMLLLDEPSAGLSPANVQRLFDSFASMRDELGTSVLLVEQNVNEALRVAATAYVMQEGRIVFHAPSSEREAVIQHLWGLVPH
jgi:branched-chain amino acid transport system ATP-binding protein